jgi:hypothetical protein
VPPRNAPLSAEQRRALALLNNILRGITEGQLVLVHGFDRSMIAGLVHEVIGRASTFNDIALQTALSSRFEAKELFRALTNRSHQASAVLACAACRRTLSASGAAIARSASAGRTSRTAKLAPAPERSIPLDRLPPRLRNLDPDDLDRLSGSLLALYCCEPGANESDEHLPAEAVYKHCLVDATRTV